MKIKLFVAREIQYFELGIFSFNSYVCYLTRGFIASTRAFNLLTCAFNLATCAFNLATRAFSLLTRRFELVTHKLKLITRGFELVTRGFELVTRKFELVTQGFELATRGFELVTRNSCFTFPPFIRVAGSCLTLHHFSVTLPFQFYLGFCKHFLLCLYIFWCLYQI